MRFFFVYNGLVGGWEIFFYAKGAKGFLRDVGDVGGEWEEGREY